MEPARSIALQPTALPKAGGEGWCRRQGGESPGADLELYIWKSIFPGRRSDGGYSSTWSGGQEPALESKLCDGRSVGLVFCSPFCLYLTYGRSSSVILFS